MKLTKEQLNKLRKAEDLIVKAYNMVETVVPSGTSQFSDEFYRRIDSADARLISMYTDSRLISNDD